MILLNLLLSLVFMTAAYYGARVRDRFDTVDIAWGLGFAVIAWVVELRQPNGLSLLLALMVTVWGLRLSLHIWQRTGFRKDDWRYEEIAKRWEGDTWVRAYFSLFLLQGFLIWLISLPIQLAGASTGGSWLTGLGLMLWLAGFVMEVVADRQLQSYLRQDKRPKVLDTGLWHYSRHPNYFGELLQWWAIGLMAVPVSYGWVGLIGPLVLTYLIVFVSGVPPIERRHMKDPDYVKYRQRTSMLIPKPPRNYNVKNT